MCIMSNANNKYLYVQVFIIVTLVFLENFCLQILVKLCGMFGRFCLKSFRIKGSKKKNCFLLSRFNKYVIQQKKRLKAREKEKTCKP